jgi:hypothetical protein
VQRPGEVAREESLVGVRAELAAVLHGARDGSRASSREASAATRSGVRAPGTHATAPLGYAPARRGGFPSGRADRCSAVNDVRG